MRVKKTFDGGAKVSTTVPSTSTWMVCTVEYPGRREAW